MLTPDARALIAKGLGILGTACVKLGEQQQGEEVMRLAVQYAQDGAAASDIFRRLGEAMLEDGRPGEAVGPLRRAANLGASPKLIWPLLARAFVRRQRFVAALACVREARLVGVPDADMVEEIRGDRAEPRHRAHRVARAGHRRESLSARGASADPRNPGLLHMLRPSGPVAKPARARG